MRGLDRLIEKTYEQAKSGHWNRVLSQWHDAPVIARRCSRYQRESSGWTFLHQAAFFGNETVCRELIRLGASAARQSREGKTAADVAEEKRYMDLAGLLRKACQDEDGAWQCPADPDLLPASALWHEAVEQRAAETMLVSYAQGVVYIAKGGRDITQILWDVRLSAGTVVMIRHGAWMVSQWLSIVKEGRKGEG